MEGKKRCSLRVGVGAIGKRLPHQPTGTRSGLFVGLFCCLFISLTTPYLQYSRLYFRATLKPFCFVFFFFLRMRQSTQFKLRGKQGNTHFWQNTPSGFLLASRWNLKTIYAPSENSRPLHHTALPATFFSVFLQAERRGHF